jgi:serine/threonine protein kinase
MPAESLEKAEFSRASDVYAFGITLIEIITGQHPWYLSFLFVQFFCISCYVFGITLIEIITGQHPW